MQKLFLKNRPLYLDPADLIQSGGEGMVFRVGETAVKLYHAPTPLYQEKLTFFFQSGLAGRLPAAVVAPCAPVLDERQAWLGYQMPLLPAGSRPLRQLARPHERQQHGLNEAALPALLQQVHTTLAHLHRQGVIVGDLNDTNLFFTPAGPPPPSVYWIDADSYQFAYFPCPVALPAFLDPQLYGVTDFSSQPHFTVHSDWYAYLVLLVKTLLGVHPYGGTHPQYKTLPARAQAGISILNPAVTWPPHTRPLDTLSDELLHLLHRVFEKGERPPVPAQLVSQALRPAAHGRRPASPVPARPAPRQKVLFTTGGLIAHVALLANGRLLAIVYENQAYHLVRLGVGGPQERNPLFTGSPGYRFGLFGGRYLVVNPPQQTHLLLLDVASSPGPQKLTLVDTAVFRQTAVFAATPAALYRIAGQWIMRGVVQNGHYVEEAVATVHKNQTWFRPSPYGEAIAGYHRLFAAYRFFVQTAQGSFDCVPPPLPAGARVAAADVALGQDTAAVGLVVKADGRVTTHLHRFTRRGQWLDETEEEGDGLEAILAHYPVLPPPGEVPETAVLRQHPAGLLIQEPDRLLFRQRA